MKGKSTFTTREIDELKCLINKKNSLPSDEQKAVRDKMRKMQFYITDFTAASGFEVSDLQELIERGAITIIGPVNSPKNNTEAMPIQVKIKNQSHTASPIDLSLSSFDKAFLEKHGFVEHITYREFMKNPSSIRKIPDLKGLYIVISTSPDKEFLQIGTGGYFKEKNPNVSVEILAENWIEDTGILYIGKAGGISENGVESNSTLRRRLNTYFKFGSGEPVGHWGGRFIWQLKNPNDLILFWRPCDEAENPVDLEHKLIKEFKNHYGRFPFANLKA